MTAGLLQQPASQYYHYIQGAGAELQLWNSWVVRGQYLERPRFAASGYVDQDFISFVDTGCGFFKWNWLEILGYGGVGRAWGYIKREQPLSTSEQNRNDYQMTVFSVTMEAGVHLEFLDVRLGHSQHIGQGDRYQTEAKVAWPFSTYFLSLSKSVGSL